MGIETLQELCTVNVIENFKTNGAVINIYDLGDKVCKDIIDRLFRADKIHDFNVRKLQVKRIESMIIMGLRPTEKMCSWLVDVILAGLEQLDLLCANFDKTTAKTIVDKYETSVLTSNNGCALEAPNEPHVVAALQTLRLADFNDDDAYYDCLPRMLSIFADTLKTIEIMGHNNCVPEGERHELLDTIGTLSLDKLSLTRVVINSTHRFTITPSMQHLKALKLMQIKGVSDQHLLTFLEVAGENLEQLFIQDCEEITDSTLQNIQLFCPNLVSLCLSDSEKLTTAALEQFFATASLTKLQRLSIGWVTAMTDAVVAKLVSVGRLMYIEICGCHAITLPSLEAVASVQTVKYVNLDNCDSLNSKDVKDVMTRYGLTDCYEYNMLHPADLW